VLVVLLGCQSKKFNQTKPRRYRPWHGDWVPPLGFAVGWPTALLGRHLVKDVVLSEISLELLTTVIPDIFSVLVFPGIRYSRYRYFSVGIVVLKNLAGTPF
jgi:hypothetical protein